MKPWALVQPCTVKCSRSPLTASLPGSAAERFEGDDGVSEAAARGHQISINNLIIKRFARMTIRDLEAYLDNLEIVEKFIPDMVILDYFGLVNPEARGEEEHRIALGQAFISFRSLMIERHMAGVTPQQSSKLGAEARSVKLSHVAEDWSLTNTADLVYTFSSTDMEKRHGLGRLYVGKARDETDQFGVLLSQSFATGQFVLQSTYLDSHYFDLLEKLPKDKEDGEIDAPEGEDT
jgi:hypothetical protein